MKLNKPGIDLTGEYTRVISTFADEQSASTLVSKAFRRGKQRSPVVTLLDDGLYDILSRTALPDEDSPEAANVKCLLGIENGELHLPRKCWIQDGVNVP
ncbi:uncharacterized protein LOC108627404 [Ceratina calcarata]|uniref:Uncharacterized protein LOC108627404 n=1 Tax=Ceratina calcarata TaxID=156304 RepID=A0AAJ7J3R2_9HYME|nr:uncharacterized protein LOC108627404 [Ceratina calcarata]